MPQGNFWLHDENKETWDKLENKSAWVNDQLLKVSVHEILRENFNPAPGSSVVVLPGQIVAYCGFGHPIEIGAEGCGVKGCKYAQD